MELRKLIFIFILISPLLSCLNNKPKGQFDNATVKMSEEPNKLDITIIPFNEEWYWIFKNASPTGISEIEIKQTTEILEKAVTDNNQKLNLNSRFSIGLDGYKKQLVPVLNERGEKEVWVNMFCSGFDTDNWNWKIAIVDVDDGGNCYWNVKVNLTTGEYYELSINGYA